MKRSKLALALVAVCFVAFSVTGCMQKDEPTPAPQQEEQTMEEQAPQTEEVEEVEETEEVEEAEEPQEEMETTEE